MTDPVDNQELVVHLFALIDGPEADVAYQQIRRLWSACSALLGTTEPIPGIPRLMSLPERREEFSQTVAAQETPNGDRQAVLRRVGDVLNLSVDLAQPTPQGLSPQSNAWLTRLQAARLPPARRLGWIEFAQLWTQASETGSKAVLGETRLFLARAPSFVTGTVEAKAELGHALEPLLPYREDRPRSWCQCGTTTTAGYAVWDTRLEGSIGTREIVLISAPDRDEEFSAWAWSDGKPDLPPFARYLMEAAKLRHQARLLNSRHHQPHSDNTERALAELGGTSAPEAHHPEKVELLRSRLSLLRKEENRLTALTAEQRRLHQEISIIRDNLREAAGRDGDLGMFAEDLAQARWLIEHLDRDLGYLKMDLDGAARIRSAAAEELTEFQQPHTVTANDEKNIHIADGLEEPVLDKPAHRMADHIDRAPKADTPPTKSDNRIFIGHGRSPAWRELKDFLQDRLHLEWEEFNRVSVAGVWTGERLSSMLENASMAFLICTAEDEHADNTQHARENVIYEAGFFQGRLGFKRAIILLEDSCSEFSNIHGLGQIRFPKDNISAKFEEIRNVLEREGMIPSASLSSSGQTCGLRDSRIRTSLLRSH
jgi:predicted nucleotide-binding protein